MLTNRLAAALNKVNEGPPPVWMMRQAGRYHSHYQNIRQNHGFVEICKTPALAAEVAIGPMEDFGFDAAILFSDILFPLDVLGQPLTFSPGPQFSFLLKTKEDIARLSPPAEGAKVFEFQAEALRLTRARLGEDKGLIGFVGAPLTLFVFGVMGSHKHGIEDAITGLTDGRLEMFMEKMIPLLAGNMVLQAQALHPQKLEMLTLFDSCAGDIPGDLYKDIYLPYLQKVLALFRDECPDTPVLYYGKGLGENSLALLEDMPIQALGIDQDQDMPAMFARFGTRFALQGNFNPVALTWDEDVFEKEAQAFFHRMGQVPKALRKGWVCGLGHGVTPQAKEANVRRFVQIAQSFKG
ncbi:MAG: uroporphyrinogen decarboxylase [Alphaproteobacteria bacterium CG_4_10_14_0_8_um_filter_53_9]|nr:MAG: uroporphyrinogen decarboxylase [Alphaproteobacteria bacterium CG_4_10_14_0_8_um_filter_53_9]